ncbi:hypothetical protein [Streptomyces anulatus]|uniref:Uncharacterized protein n=1 Tax=Streptomyces anulatus TaxID=1892 RepID=A0A7K3R6F2_STRAQ|nr:hypothetical protein [Streptomyces anulatus]NEB97748.1 hypothetical protein [Streptomyces anulatus]NED24325.1 hypothetical protein [Streptomyces anulatus]
MPLSHRCRSRRIAPSGPGPAPTTDGSGRCGVDQFAVYDMHDNRENTIDAYGSTVIPALG